jgi:hypothetical protein
MPVVATGVPPQIAGICRLGRGHPTSSQREPEAHAAVVSKLGQIAAPVKALGKPVMQLLDLCITFVNLLRKYKTFEQLSNSFKQAVLLR